MLHSVCQARGGSGRSGRRHTACDHSQHVGNGGLQALARARLRSGLHRVSLLRGHRGGRAGLLQRRLRHAVLGRQLHLLHQGRLHLRVRLHGPNGPAAGLTRNHHHRLCLPSLWQRRTALREPEGDGVGLPHRQLVRRYLRDGRPVQHRCRDGATSIPWLGIRLPVCLQEQRLRDRVVGEQPPILTRPQPALRHLGRLPSCCHLRGCGDPEV
mmetsp:Transcript_24987/g.68648  ORF Transcript_24987/g.68648 Transcript_24987/m.68648 type:complete len:212 (+) Transcript_24987:742-1377(+)